MCAYDQAVLETSYVITFLLASSLLVDPGENRCLLLPTGMLQYRALLMRVYLNNNQDFLRRNHYCLSVCTNIFILSLSRSNE